MLIGPSLTPTSGALHAQQRVGWQPSRFLADRGEAERAFAVAERLGSVNAAAAELGTTWLSLRKAFTRHGLGMPARNPEAVRQRAIAARQRTGQPVTPTLDPVFVALNPGALPARPRSPAGLYRWVRRDEEYATLGANVVVELYSEAAPASLPPAPGRSSAVSSAPTVVAATASSVPAAGRVTGRPAPTLPTSAHRQGDGRRCPMTRRPRPARWRCSLACRPDRLLGWPVHPWLRAGAVLVAGAGQEAALASACGSSTAHCRARPAQGARNLTLWRSVAAITGLLVRTFGA
jgi:hypothetical protein